jgi:hypothetical protein
MVNLNCQRKKEFSKYLKPTNYIDCGNLEIIEKAKQITQGSQTDCEKERLCLNMSEIHRATQFVSL